MTDTTKSLVIVKRIALPAAILDESVSLITDDAIKLRDDIVERAEGIERVAGASSQATAANMLEEIQGVLAAVESDRQAIKRPHLTYGRRIDDSSYAFTVPLDQQKKRLKKLLSDFAIEQERIATDARRAQEAELARLAEERRLAEAQAAIAETPQQVDAAETAVLAADMKAEEVIMSAPLAVVAKPSNIKTTIRWKVEVKDATALYKVFPALVILTPSMIEINKAVRKMAETQPGQAPKLPGCEITRETDVSTK